jgi:raffinose/stachyose/melibiose transport system permease protein
MQGMSGPRQAENDLVGAEVTVPGETSGKRARSARVREVSGREPRRIAYLFLLPALIVYTVFTIAPAVQTIWLSFFQWEGIGPKKWVGTANYNQIYHDPLVILAFEHSLFLLTFYAVLPIIIGLFVATAISRIPIRGSTAFRTILFLPQVVASVAVAVTWRYVYSYGGPLNQLLSVIGLRRFAQDWLGSFTWALPSIGVIGTWTEFGLCMVLFISGVQKIPQSLYDAVRVDGAGAIREFAHVILPAIRREIAVAAMITVIGGLRGFDIVYVTTAGGPGYSTAVPALEIFQHAFQLGEVGSAAAISTVLTLVIIIVAFVIARLGEVKKI